MHFEAARPVPGISPVRLRLKHELGYSTKEVAELMGISWPAARKLEQRARDRLEELCREEGIL